MSGRSTQVNIENSLKVVINPATEEKQDAIITAIGGIGGAIAYDSRLDDGVTYMYVGEALPGTADSTSAWRIKRYIQATLQGNYADGVSTFNKIWNNRATYVY